MYCTCIYMYVHCTRVHTLYAVHAGVCSCTLYGVYSCILCSIIPVYYVCTCTCMYLYIVWCVLSLYIMYVHVLVHCMLCILPVYYVHVAVHYMACILSAERLSHMHKWLTYSLATMCPHSQSSPTNCELHRTTIIAAAVTMEILNQFQFPMTILSSFPLLLSPSPSSYTSPLTLSPPFSPPPLPLPIPLSPSPPPLSLFREGVEEKLLSVGSVKDELGVVERMRPGWRKLCFWNDSYLVGVGRGEGLEYSNFYH